jgi:plastocyanin
MNAINLFIFFTIISFLLTIPPIVFAESNWNNLNVEIERSDRIDGEIYDIIRVSATFTNNEKDPIVIYSRNAYLEDTQDRRYATSDYYDLNSKGYEITEGKCPIQFSIDLNPGITDDGDFCFIVPKENLDFRLHLYQYSIEWCEDPAYGSCSGKTIKLDVRSPSVQQVPTPPAPNSNKITSTVPVVPGSVTVSSGSIVPGCEKTRSCYLPYAITVGKGSTVTWHNDDSVAHTVTSGNSKGPDGLFDSGSFMAGSTFSKQFDKDGVFNYFCTIHPWMVGQVVVKRGETIVPNSLPTISKDSIPPKILKPTDITVNAEKQSGTKVAFDVLTIDDTDKIVKPTCSKPSGSIFPVGKSTITCNAIDSSGNRAIPITFTITVNSTKEIPDWIKNVASFWCNGSIDDTSFIEGIQYLINNKIILISANSKSDGTQGIPQWVKNNACWWADGSINDKDFASGIEFLIENGIVKVNS